MKEHTPKEKIEVSDPLEAVVKGLYDLFGKNKHFPFTVDLPTVEKYFRSALTENRKRVREEIVNKLVEIEKRKWNDAVHCTCLGYAIVEIFGEEYEKVLLKIRSPLQ